MKYPLSELIDRYSILHLKVKRLPEDKAVLAEYEKFRKAIDEFGVQCDEFVQAMIQANGRIWDLEFDIRNGKDLPLEEVGRRALRIREINGERIAIKNQIAKKFGGFQEIKVGHHSSRPKQTGFFARVFRFVKARYAPRGARLTYSQSGEDLTMHDILLNAEIKKARYVDIGAHHPIFGNNTYLFYRKGGLGVLVEPNPDMCQLIRKLRPRDICVNAGAGARNGKANFFVFPQSTRSTFSADQASSWEKSSGQRFTNEKRDIITLDTIIQDHFHGDAPDIISIDAEGLDAEILSGFSWKVRPKIFCVESGGMAEAVMEAHDYVLKARIFQNVIFVDKGFFDKKRS